jgi:NTE family protein
MQIHDLWQTSANETNNRCDSERYLALVLGGGGGKGGAHLGAIEVIESAGLPIDLIVGASIGGAVGALYAAGYSVDEFGAAFGGATLWKLFERDPSGMGLLGVRRVRAILEEMLGECCFEQLAIRCAVVATDLVTGGEVVIDRGPIVDALMATMAFPGIYPPVQRDEMLLADGGIVNNLPVDVAHALGAQKVIAVDLGYVCDDFTPMPAASGALGWLNPLPSMPLTLANRGLGVMMARLTRYRLAQNPPDLLLCPEVEQVPTVDLSRINDPACRAAGEQVARAALGELRSLRDWRCAESYSGIPLHPIPQQAQHLLAVG